MKGLLSTALTAIIMAAASAPLAQEPKPATPPPAKVNAVIETSKGVIHLELDAEKAPITVKNFVAYAKAGFYDGTIIHQVVPGRIQGGGFTADMLPKPGVKPAIVNEATNGLKNKRGSIGMARANDPNSATSQFYINVADNPLLDYPSFDSAGYAVFGAVTAGMDVVSAIAASPTKRKGRYEDAPVETITINKVTIEEPK